MDTAIRKRVLLVEDDPSSGRGTKRFLEVNGWQVSWATDGQKGLTLFRREKPDAIVVDWEMPKMDGEALTRAIRQEDARTIIVVYSAKADEWGGERLYEVDADMVVDKGKGATLLLAALERCLRRATASGGDAYIHRLAAEAEFNVNTGRLKIGQKEVKLSGMLLNLLRTLCEHQNQAVEDRTLMDELWGNAVLGKERQLQQYVSQLREYFKETEGVHVERVGKGYVLATEGR